MHSEPNCTKTKPAIQVSSPGKIILFGEHSVVYGKLALAAGLDIRTFVQIFENDTQNFGFELTNLGYKRFIDLRVVEKFLNEPLPIGENLTEFNLAHPEFLQFDDLVKKCELCLCSAIEDFYDLQINIQKALVGLFYLINGIFGSTNVNSLPIFIKASSDLDIGSGTGSSASFLVSVSASLLLYLKLKLNADENVSKQQFRPFVFENKNINFFDEDELEIICKWAFSGERIIHGIPSGIDNTICTYGSMVEYRKGVKPTIFKAFPLRILLIDTKIPKDTGKQVTKTRHLYEKYPDLVENIFRAMEDVSFQALLRLKALNNTTEENASNIIEELSDLTSLNHGLLNALGVSHSRLEEIMLILNEYNLKGKLTGAGGGGYAISIVPPTFSNILVETVVNLLNQRGFSAIFSTIGGEGVRVDCVQ